MMKFQAQDSTQTLAEGLAEMRETAGLLEPDGLEGRARELFENHDAAHVVFGCGTTLEQETLIDLWTLFGTDVGFGGYLSYLGVPEAREIIGDVGLWQSLRAFIKHRRRAMQVIRRARGMERKWAWGSQDDFLHRPLAEIREELGIQVAGA